MKQKTGSEQAAVRHRDDLLYRTESDISTILRGNPHCEPEGPRFDTYYSHPEMKKKEKGAEKGILMM